MAMKSRTELKQTFVTGAKPAQQDFTDWLDSFRHTDDPQDNISLENKGIFFPLQIDDDNTRWRLGTPDIVDTELSRVTNAVSLRRGRYGMDVMNFVGNGSYYFDRLIRNDIVAIQRLMVGGRLHMTVNSPADLNNFDLMQVYAGDRLFNNNFNGTNPEGWICIKPGVTGTFPGTVTAGKNGPTLWFSDISNIRVGDIIEWNGGRYKIINQDGPNAAFYTYPEPVPGPEATISYPQPVFAAYGIGRGAEEEAPTDLTPDDAGWQYYIVGGVMLLWDGTKWG